MYNRPAKNKIKLMNKQNTQQTKGFSIVIASLALDESDMLDQLDFTRELTFSLPVNSNFLLWQAFHNDIKDRKSVV